MKKIPIHPFFFASYAVLAFIAYNNLQSISGMRALFTSLIVALIIFVVFLVVTKSARKAGLISSICILIIFSFGHLKRVLSQIGILEETLSHDLVLVSLSIVAVVVWIIYVFRFQLKHLDVGTMYFNLVSVILIVFPITQIIISSAQPDTTKLWIDKYISQSWVINGVELNDASSRINSLSELPDVYYIILDSYARKDVLADIYGYDNSDFINYLKERGFYIAEESTSNYATTEQSISSALNMMHIDDMPDFYNNYLSSVDTKLIQDTSFELVSQNRVVELLKNLGYTIVEYDSTYDNIQFSLSDVHLRSQNIQQVSTTQTMVDLFIFDSSLVSLLPISNERFYKRGEIYFNNHREQVLYALNNLQNFDNGEGNYFVFSHIVSPHPPYVFGPNGEKIKNLEPYTLTDMRMASEQHIKYYRDQVHYLNQLVSHAIKEILNNSNQPPIIILQADHGSKVYSEKDPWGELRENLDFSILNAYYLPNNDYKLIYPSITPVNSFRVIFNEYFGFNLPLLEDQSFVLENVDGKLDFVVACELYETCISK